MQHESAPRAEVPIRTARERPSSLASQGTGTTVRELVERVTSVLAVGTIADARAEARDVIAAICDRPRFWPSLNAHELVSADVAQQALRSAELRQMGAPFAYAVGRASFRYLSLSVDQRVLIPRQETELLVERVLEARRSHRGGVAVDMGTGSGAIAIALATEGTFERVIATDVSGDAIAVAQCNVDRYRTQLRCPITVHLGAGLSAIGAESVDVLVSNPPYVAFEEATDLPISVRDWEPSAALFSPDHGLAFTREIVNAAPRYLRASGLLALEGDSRRVPLVAELVASSGAFRDVQTHADLTGRDRFVFASRI